jgi:hypothetical protein
MGVMEAIGVVSCKDACKSLVLSPAKMHASHWCCLLQRCVHIVGLGFVCLQVLLLILRTQKGAGMIGNLHWTVHVHVHVHVHVDECGHVPRHVYVH